MAASDPEGPELADADLIAAARAGDTEAYGVLYARHSHAARALARQLGRDDAESDDLVAETFARVLDVLSRGGGPEVGFRAYALTAMRRIKYDRARGEARQVVLDDLDPYAPGVPFDDRTLEGLERSMVARAFASLPERWQTVLWHTAIEGERPAEVAPLLGISAGSVAALAYRAREGLRQAYLQMHLSGAVQEGCQPALERMGAYVRGGLSRRETRVVERHIDECDKCRGLYLELADVNSSLRTIIGPIILGPAVGGYLASVHGGAGLFGALWLRHLRRVPKQAAGAAAVVAALAIALPLGWMAWQGDTSDHVGGGGQGGQAEAAAPGGAPPSSNNPAPSQKNPPAAHHPHKQQGASESSAGGGDSS
ncbi:MAG: sigma-70 family RNA polymerase sigma factor, partial [Streptosporangiaceae bacterium]